MFGDNIIDQAKIMSLALFTIAPTFSLTSLSYATQSFSSNTTSETNVFTSAVHCGWGEGAGNNNNNNKTKKVCVHLETKVNI